MKQFLVAVLVALLVIPSPAFAHPEGADVSQFSGNIFTSEVILAAIIAVGGVLLTVVSAHWLAAQNAKTLFRHSQFQTIFSAKTQAYTAFLNQYVIWKRSPQTPEDTTLLLESLYSAKLVASDKISLILVDIPGAILHPDSVPVSLAQLMTEFMLEANKELTTIVRKVPKGG